MGRTVCAWLIWMETLPTAPERNPLCFPFAYSALGSHSSPSANIRKQADTEKYLQGAIANNNNNSKINGILSLGSIKHTHEGLWIGLS